MSMSKPLGHDDSSGFHFAKEMLKGDTTAGINFDRIQYHPKRGYMIFEYLLCEETQPRVNPYTSHPKNYWRQNPRKFISIWKIAKILNAQVYLVNYAKIGTEHEDKILVIRVLDMNNDGITEEKIVRLDRKSFSDWFRRMNKECLA